MFKSKKVLLVLHFWVSYFLLAKYALTCRPCDTTFTSKDLSQLQNMVKYPATRTTEPSKSYQVK